MLAKYLIGFVGVGTVAGGVTVTTIALSSNQDPVNNKEVTQGPKEQLTGEQTSKASDKGPGSSRPEGQQQRK